MTDQKRDHVAEYIARKNAEGAARRTPFPHAAVPLQAPPTLADDPVGAFIWRRNAAASVKPRR
jgi:hypothetical protein